MGKQKYNLIDGFEETAAEMYKSGKTLQEIANVIGTYPGKVGKILKELGLKRGRQYKYINEHYFDVIDSEDKAYILGFLIADGCIRLEERKNVTSYRIAFSNNIDDSEISQISQSEIKDTERIQLTKGHVEKVSKYIEKYQFNLGAEEIREFFWHIFCDKWIEEIKTEIKVAINKGKRDYLLWSSKLKL